MKTRVLSISALLLFVGWAVAADWPQWRGPQRTGVSAETGLLKVWPKEGPKLLWTFKNAGLGHGSFAVVGNTLYTLGTRGDDEIVIALDVTSGAELWTAKIAPLFVAVDQHIGWGDGPRSTPTIDGNHLYALGGQGELVCLDIAAKGKEVWRKNLPKDLGGEMMTGWGFSESPLIDGPLLLCTPGGAQGTVAALNKMTGTLVWQSKELKNKAPYSSIVVAEIHGVRQYVQNSFVDVTGGFVSGIAAQDGKVLWTMPTFKGDSYNIGPTPIVKDNLVYVSTQNGVTGCHLFALDKSFKAKDLYSKANQKVMKNNHGGVVLIGDHVYGHSERSGWVCQEFKTGDQVSVKTLDAHSTSLTAADGMLYFFTDDGVASLVEATPKMFTEISSFKLPERSKIPDTRATSRKSKTWAHPVVANGHLYLRDHDLLFCFDVKAK